MIRISPCDLHNFHTCCCHASQIRISPQEKKMAMMKAFNSAQLVGRDDRKAWGRRKGRALPPTPTPLQSLGPLLGASCCSPSSCLLSPTLLLPLFPAFSRPPSPTPPSPSCLSHSPRGLIYGCAAPETGMTTHAFLCFVSSLACWLALWLTACTWCVFTLYSFHAVSVLPQSKNVPLFLLVLFVVVKKCVSPATALNTEHISSMQKLYFGINIQICLETKIICFCMSYLVKLRTLILYLH